MAHDNMKISLQLFELVLKKWSPGTLLVILMNPVDPLRMEYVICTKKSVDFNRMWPFHDYKGLVRYH